MARRGETTAFAKGIPPVVEVKPWAADLQPHWHRLVIAAPKQSRQHCARKYNMSLEVRAQMLHDQGFRCGMCQRGLHSFGKYDADACVDHCHETGMVRGILCGACNKALGFYEYALKNGAETYMRKAWEERAAPLPVRATAAGIKPGGPGKWHVRMTWEEDGKHRDTERVVYCETLEEAVEAKRRLLVTLRAKANLKMGKKLRQLLRLDDKQPE